MVAYRGSRAPDTATLGTLSPGFLPALTSSTLPSRLPQSGNRSFSNPRFV
jgi:hypothetical protein